MTPSFSHSNRDSGSGNGDGGHDYGPAPSVSIEAHNFSWTHAGRSQPALSGLDFRISAGERVLICGDSGSGKSTLLAAMAGVLGGDEDGESAGALWLRDRHGNRHHSGESIPVGLVLQDPDSQVIASRVGDDVAFGCENLGLERDEIWTRVRQALSVVGLDFDLDHPTAHLSGGEKQRLALAGIIAMRPGIIILDEPTANLDPEGARDIAEAVAAVIARTGSTLIVVEHNYEVWQDSLERALELKDGKLVDDADADSIIARRQITGLHPAQPHLADNPAVLWANDLVARDQPEHLPPRSMQAPSAASTVITGANGTGKTTLLMALAGLRPSVRGEVGVADSVRRGLKGPVASWRSRKLAQRLGFVFQDPEHQFVARTVEDELWIGPKIMEMSIEQSRVDELLERLRLDHLRTANPFTLSGGEKRRLSVATALIAAPSVVLLDEPTFGQDPGTFVELVDIVRGLVNEGVSVVSVTHDMNYIYALADHQVVLE